MHNERYTLMENELDQVHKRLDELHMRTDMNIRGRLIEELEHIPNIVKNISSLPNLNDNIDKMNMKFETLEERILNIDKRIYSLLISNDKLDLSF